MITPNAENPSFQKRPNDKWQKGVDSFELTASLYALLCMQIFYRQEYRSFGYCRAFGRATRAKNKGGGLRAGKYKE